MIHFIEYPGKGDTPYVRLAEHQRVERDLAACQEKLERAQKTAEELREQINKHRYVEAEAVTHWNRRATPPAGDALQALVNAQACNAALWFDAETAPEAYLQCALRVLHAAVEHYSAPAGDAERPSLKEKR